MLPIHKVSGRICSLSEKKKRVLKRMDKKGRQTFSTSRTFALPFYCFRKEKSAVQEKKESEVIA